MIQGMTSEASLRFNGTYATVYDWKENLGRWRVQSDLDGELKALQEKNLVLQHEQDQTQKETPAEPKPEESVMIGAPAAPLAPVAPSPAPAEEEKESS